MKVEGQGQLRAGVVVYKRKGKSFHGEWTHEDIRGALAREVVKDVDEGALEGEWPVEISAPDGKLFYSGRLKSDKYGDGLKLTWSGTFTHNGKTATFEGIGIAVTPDLIAATFEESR